MYNLCSKSIVDYVDCLVIYHIYKYLYTSTITKISNQNG